MTQNREKKNIPQHVAIVMDGNGRWAKSRHKSRINGHRAGAETLKKAIQFASKKGIEVLSVFAFSSENWNRPAEEINYLMRLFLQAMKDQTKDAKQQNIQVRIIGDLDPLSQAIRDQVAKTESLTSNNTGMKFIIAINYGGQWDILQAVQKIAKQIDNKELQLSEINSANFEKYLMIADLPCPDLFIRTSGEQRISNFFLWQLAYTELYFTEVLWPDFDEENFEQALKVYAQRARRFGAIDINDQVEISNV